MRLSPRITRRQVIRMLGAATAAAALPACSDDESVNPAPQPFLSADEQHALGALADVVLPPDDAPGGKALGAVQYTERLLSAFDVDPPALFAGGPYSGRQPFPDKSGGPSSQRPDDDFAQFLPLDRANAYALRLWLYGSAGLPGGGPNDSVLGAVVGLRDRVKAGLAAAMAKSKAPLDTLDAKSVADIFRGLDGDTQDLFIELVTEAAFAAPEYGGNVDGKGWAMIHFEGDTMPLGFSWFDESTGTYRERPDAPVSKPNPGPDPMPMDETTLSFIRTVTKVAGGKEFP